jgi:hypothetical protein
MGRHEKYRATGKEQCGVRACGQLPEWVIRGKWL